MRSELILTEKEKKLRKIKRLEKLSNNSNTEDVIPVNNNYNDLSYNDLPEQEVIKLDRDNMDDFILKIDIDGHQLCHIYGQYYGKCTIKVCIDRPLTDYNNNFNELEGNRITELLNAMKTFKKPFGPIVSQTNTYRESLCAYSEHLEQVIIKLGVISKCLQLFNSINLNDQIALIKYGSIEISCLRSIIGYNDDTKQIVLPDENPDESVIVKIDTINDNKQYLYKAFIKFYEKIVRIWDSDELILDLVTAILLFNPNRPKLQHRNTIKFNQQIYIYLLKRYLLLRYRSDSECDSKFLKLMNTFKDLHHLFFSYIRCVNEHKCEEVVDCGQLLNELHIRVILVLLTFCLCRVVSKFIPEVFDRMAENNVNQEWNQRLVDQIWDQLSGRFGRTLQEEFSRQLEDQELGLPFLWTEPPADVFVVFFFGIRPALRVWPEAAVFTREVIDRRFCQGRQKSNIGE
ncbi:uncharacterized protein LOC128966351 [Oppia nitens]|uniref:uncharacterized protein LOC128966351 n=1 Tax=Oppia nitens TaxID=1686743 RepID=UPI0023D9AEEC|nr:uncharacterized protein LOC128966351 [Oppia nitens]